MSTYVIKNGELYHSMANMKGDTSIKKLLIKRVQDYFDEIGTASRGKIKVIDVVLSDKEDGYGQRPMKVLYKQLDRPERTYSTNMNANTFLK